MLIRPDVLPFFFAGLALMFAISLYLGSVFYHVPGSLGPERRVLYLTTSLLVLGIILRLSKLFVRFPVENSGADSSEWLCQARHCYMAAINV